MKQLACTDQMDTQYMPINKKTVVQAAARLIFLRIRYDKTDKMTTS